MSTHDRSSRVKPDALPQVAAQGVARALEARRIAAKTELSAAEIEQVSGGVSLSSQYSLKINPKWLGIWPEDLYFKDSPMIDPGRFDPGAFRGY